MKPCFLAFALCAVATAGCDDDKLAGPSGEDPGETSFTGTLVFVEDESPMADLEVTLFEPATQTAIARDVTDSAGRFEFSGIPAGSYIPVVHANGYRPVLLAQPRWKIEAEERIDIELRMRRTDAIRMSDKTLTGRVMDREAQQPIPNARIEMNFLSPGPELAGVNWSEYRGWSTTLEATSDGDGYFVLQPVPVIETINAEYIPDYRVTAEGYQSRTMDRNYDPESVGERVWGVRLIPGEDLGSIEGYVRNTQGEPLEGVPVSVEWRRSDNSFRGFEPVDAPTHHILMPNASAVSDATGFYKITGVPRGIHVVEAGIDPEDGWVGDEIRGVEIEGFNSTASLDVVAIPAIVPVYPEEGIVLDDIPDRIEWEAYPNAVSYTIRLFRDSDGLSAFLDTEEPLREFDASANFFNPDASFSWEVLALDGDGRGIGLTDRPHVFHIRRPSD